LDRVVLIQHQGCAFYTTRLGLSLDRAEEHQRVDLKRATDFVREVTGVRLVETYFARQCDGHVRFEPVEF
ncbi:MAG: hypothetical protein WBD40_13440, partial [Tepidisphaeraceae bacterium]